MLLCPSPRYQMAGYIQRGHDKHLLTGEGWILYSLTTLKARSREAALQKAFLVHAEDLQDFQNFLNDEVHLTDVYLLLPT